MRGILNCTGVRKLTISVPQATQLCPAATAGSTVAPFTTSSNDILQLGFKLQPSLALPNPWLPQEQPDSGLLDFPHLSANEGLALTTALVAAYHFSSPFHGSTFVFRNERKKRDMVAAQSLVYIMETCYRSKGDRTDTHSFRAGFSVFQNTK